MTRVSSTANLLTAGAAMAALAVILFLFGSAPARSAPKADPPAGTAGPSSAPHWVHTWTAMPQLTEPANMPPAPFTQDGKVLENSTLRQTVRVSTGGKHVRLRFSNAFGGAALPLTAVSVALPQDGKPGASAIEPGTERSVTFHGRAAVVIPVGAQVVSDPLDLGVRSRANLTVTMYLADGQASTNITSHPGSRTTSYLQTGNHLTDQDLTGATPVDHWYFLSGVEVWSGANTAAAAILGDSLTDGRGSTTNANDRWPDQLLDRLQSHPDTDHIAILNQAAGGNRILNDGLGPNGLARLDRDVLGSSAVNYLLVFEGVNDIGTAEPTEAAQKDATDALITAYDQIVVRAHAQGIRVYGATLTPFGNNDQYDDPAGHREAARQEVNTWIRTSGRFDAAIDFDKVARDPAHPEQLLPSIQVGDWLHLNPAGYRLLADAVPAALFKGKALPRDFGFY